MERLSFEKLGLCKELLKALSEIGFEETTQIQSSAIPAMLAGHDIIGQAQTGTGKTAAFALPIIQKISLNLKVVQALVVCPTRELACQVADQFVLLGKYIKGLKVVPVYGGQPIERQLKLLNNFPHVVVGTPGRILDHLKRKTLNLENARMVVLDEADKMLDMGFIEDVSYIFRYLPEERQTALFSATMPKQVIDISKYYMKSPVNIKVTPDALAASTIIQEYFVIKKGTKLDAITRVLDANDFKSVIMFCNTKSKVDRIAEQLRLSGYSAEGIHGDKSQARREKAIEMFRKGKIDILVATDVAARGIDIIGIDAVINYHPPQDNEYYVHRIGRTGRAGRQGYACTFVYRDEEYRIAELEAFAGNKIKLARVPVFEENVKEKDCKILEAVKNAIEEGGIAEYVQRVEKMASEETDLLHIAAALLKIFSKNNQQINDLNHDIQEEVKRIQEMVPVVVNLGKTDKIQPRDILGAFTAKGIEPGMMGKIEISETHTYVNVHASIVDSLIKNMYDGSIKGKKAKVEKAQ